MKRTGSWQQPAPKRAESVVFDSAPLTPLTPYTPPAPLSRSSSPTTDNSPTAKTTGVPLLSYLPSPPTTPDTTSPPSLAESIYGESPIARGSSGKAQHKRRRLELVPTISTHWIPAVDELMASIVGESYFTQLHPELGWTMALRAKVEKLRSDTADSYIRQAKKTAAEDNYDSNNGDNGDAALRRRTLTSLQLAVNGLQLGVRFHLPR